MASGGAAVSVRSGGPEPAREGRLTLFLSGDVNLETSITTSEDAWPKGINYRCTPGMLLA